ncbi:hypothetical protein AWZ03_014350 [Drosophila navojoa]|uniref:Uncharacterized protein n=1 Tax=Drosophila navojoa TaxID=7232 RepID=A0A484ARL9_DRONA|nr:uncharacterized protein LOC108655490 [Drosophila navojoa]TDG39229.1 hypothetical protein AWZ03_014350 [Drosophila navojoa]
MKPKQKPTAATAAAVSSTAVTVAGLSRLTSVRQRSKEEETRLRLRQTQPQPLLICEREMKHEAARREREAQALQKRDVPLRRPIVTPTAPKSKPTAKPAPKPLAKPPAKPMVKTTPTTKQTPKSILKPTPRPMQKPTQAPRLTTTIQGSTPKPSYDKGKQKAPGEGNQAGSQLHTQAGGDANVPIGQHTGSDSDKDSDSEDEETTKLRRQLEHFSQQSKLEFEREFRQWLAQEGIENRMHTHLRTELIKSFNSSSLGKLLTRLSSTSAQVSQQQNFLLMSPLGLALHTLVAEFLYEQNCHYTLSVYCSEMPHRHALPDFDNSVQFRFSEQERQQLLSAVLGETQREPQPQLELEQTVHKTYDITQQSLLLALVQTLISVRRTVVQQVNESTMTPTAGQLEEGTQTEPVACFSNSPDVDTTGLYQAEELIVAADGRTVFIGERVSQSLNGVDEELSDLMHFINELCKSCVPPIEVISRKAFDQLLKKEMLERQRLQGIGQILGVGEMAVKLPELPEQPEQEELEPDEDKNTVQSPVGPIQLPADLPSVPKLPQLHVEQVGSLATVQLILQKYQQQAPQDSSTQDCIHTKLDRLGAMVGELASCVQSLSNVLNLAMEQEYTVGRRKGFQQGYREGFSHGHYMGVQEGMKWQRQQRLKDRSSQTKKAPPPRRVHTSATQTESAQQRHAATSPRRRAQRDSRDVASQTAASPPETAVASRSYEQWIYEMLHSRSGMIFLERVELSLNKALEQQKHRLDELFEVKMRHHAELTRLSRRQNSWRTLCRHVERDSQSTEARELVQKIFRLLERYEMHHRLIAEKIQQTELAAEQTARIQPVWTDEEASVHSRPAASTTNSHPAPPAGSVSAPPLHNLLDLTVDDTAAPTVATAPAAPTAAAASTSSVPVSAPAHPGKPQQNSVATNTCTQSRTHKSDARPQDISSFNEALLSAKNRMLQLEQESDLLEQSFLDYLERARVQKQKINIRASCASERQQIHHTLENIREWQRRIRCDDVNLTVALPSAPSPITSSSEVDQENYQFTNAIAVARRKLFSELQSTSGTATGARTSAAPASIMCPELDLEASALANERTTIADQVQNETQHLMNRVEATLARVCKPGSLQLLTAEEQLGKALGTDLVSSSSSSTLTSLADANANRGDGPVTPPARRKLQRSMARLHQLFGAQVVAQSPAKFDDLPLTKMKTITRPWSAPTSILNTSCTATALAHRPHTAPSCRTELPAATTAGTNLLGLLDAISDVGNTTTNSSSLASSPDTPPIAMREVYAQLVSSISSASHASSSSPPSHSPEFWRRMNL